MWGYARSMTTKLPPSMFHPPKDSANALRAEKEEMPYISSWSMNK